MLLLAPVRRVRDALFALHGWWMTLVLSALGAALRLPNLGTPHEFSFDETYYAKDAFSYLTYGYEKSFVDKANELFLAGNLNVFKDAPEFVVHPPLGKWAIALGIHFFGMNPYGWRIVMALLGIIAVAVVHRTMLRLSGNVYTAALAGLFMAIDGMAIVLSRTALLDQTLMFFVLCTFAALVVDRDQYEHTLILRAYRDDVPWWRRLRPWRLVAIVCITAAMSTKWSALWFALGFALLALVWDVQARRRHAVAVGAGWLGDITWVLVAAVIGTAGYLASWIGWFRSTDGWDRTWTDGPQWLPQALRALLYYHQQALHFHVNLTSSHPYKAAPYWWLLMIRPTSFSYVTSSSGQPGCTAASCSAEVLAIGNVIIWWTATLVILALLLLGIARLLRVRLEIRGAMYDFTRRSRVRWSVVSGPLVGIAAGWLPWIYWHNRTTFTFYAIVITPFVCMIAAYGLTLFATQRVSVTAAATADADVSAMRALLVEALQEPTGEAADMQFVSTLPDDAPTDGNVTDPTPDAATPPATFEYEDIHERRFLVAVLIASMAVGFAVFFYPVWVGQVLAYDAWHARMWLPSWV